MCMCNKQCCRKSQVIFHSYRQQFLHVSLLSVSMISYYVCISDYSTQQLSDRSDKQDYQQQFGLMDDQSVVGTPDHPSSDFSPSLGLGSSSASAGSTGIGHPFSASTASASIISMSCWTLLLIINAIMRLHFI